MKINRSIVLTSVLLLVGCAQPAVLDGGEGASSAAAKADRGDGPQTAVDHALQHLRDVAKDGELNLQRQLAGETLARISAGDVWIGNMDQAAGIDLWHMCMDLVPEACGPRPTENKWDGTSFVRDTVLRELDGYQWGDRLYFALADHTDVKLLAATLVHEVNHVLNRSECSYYKDLDSHEVDVTYAFVEEFRAFYAECWFVRGAQANVENCRAYALDNLEERGYDMAANFEELMPGEKQPLEQISEELIESTWWEEGSFGYLIPSRDCWPEEFGQCE